jgi:putative transposase
LPERFPPYQTCHRRFQQWVREGVLRGVLEALAEDLRARAVLAPLANRFSQLRKIWTDSIYSGGIVEWVKNLRHRNRLNLEIVKRPEGVKGFLVLARRWVVERTFAWLSFHRRLSKDYEYLPETSEAFIRIAMIRLMLA